MNGRMIQTVKIRRHSPGRLTDSIAGAPLLLRMIQTVSLRRDVGQRPKLATLGYTRRLFFMRQMLPSSRYTVESCKWITL
jgi:hypothetical protein